MGTFTISQFHINSHVKTSEESENTPPGNSHFHIPLGRCENVNLGRDGSQSKKEVDVENSTASTPFNGQPDTLDIPDGIAPEEYQECYDTAYSAFIGKGLPHGEADRKAREEIKKFIADHGTPASGAAVSSPITPDEEIEF
jgi:hypothetical protein